MATTVGVDTVEELRGRVAKAVMGTKHLHDLCDSAVSALLAAGERAGEKDRERAVEKGRERARLIRRRLLDGEWLNMDKLVVLSVKLLNKVLQRRGLRVYLQGHKWGGKSVLLTFFSYWLPLQSTMDERFVALLLRLDGSNADSNLAMFKTAMNTGGMRELLEQLLSNPGAFGVTEAAFGRARTALALLGREKCTNEEVDKALYSVLGVCDSLKLESERVDTVTKVTPVLILDEYGKCIVENAINLGIHPSMKLMKTLGRIHPGKWDGERLWTRIFAGGSNLSPLLGKLCVFRFMLPRWSGAECWELAKKFSCLFATEQESNCSVEKLKSALALSESSTEACEFAVDQVVDGCPGVVLPYVMDAMLPRGPKDIGIFQDMVVRRVRDVVERMAAVVSPIVVLGALRAWDWDWFEDVGLCPRYNEPPSGTVLRIISDQLFTGIYGPAVQNSLKSLIGFLCQIWDNRDSTKWTGSTIGGVFEVLGLQFLERGGELVTREWKRIEGGTNIELSLSDEGCPIVSADEVVRFDVMNSVKTLSGKLLIRAPPGAKAIDGVVIDGGTMYMLQLTIAKKPEDSHDPRDVVKCWQSTDGFLADVKEKFKSLNLKPVYVLWSPLCDVELTLEGTKADVLDTMRVCVADEDLWGVEWPTYL